MFIGSYLWRRKSSWSVSRVPLALCVLFLAAGGMMRMRVCASSFDIKEHLSTKAPYIHRVKIKGAPSLYETPDPPGYKPVFMYLLARHGSRWPTEKRMKQINSLQHLFRSIDNPAHSWMRGWTSPVAHLQYLAGDLHPVGEREMFDLATRLKRRFPQLINDTYAPRRYPIISTQVPRAAQSASAFALSFFSRPAYDWRSEQQYKKQKQPGSARKRSRLSSSGSDSKGEGVKSWLPQPVAINMLPKKHDPVLRFFESCKGYLEHEDRALRWLAPWMHGHWMRVVPGLEQRMGLPEGSLNTCHVDALWQLCAFEAGLGMDTTDHPGAGLRGTRQRNGNERRRVAADKRDSSVCQLFTQQDAQLLEWVEDVRLYETQGYGAAVNYEIAAPLLADIASALASAAAADASGRQPLQRARLMFAHCETLTPLATLLGLFKPQGEEASIIPELPEEGALQQAVGISSEQVEKDFAAAADSMDDLPLVILGTEDPVLGQQQQNEQQEEQQAMQSDQEPHLVQQRLRKRKLSELSSDGSSSDASAVRSASSTFQQQQQQQQQQAVQKHHHGPEVVGCSYKGRDPMDASLLLPPPEGWSAGFNPDDSDRVWRGGRVAPLGGNLLLVLYGRTDSSSSDQRANGDDSSSSSSSAGGGLYFGDFKLRLVYNEQVIRIPGCGDGLDCSLEKFLRGVVGSKASREKFRQHCSSRLQLGQLVGSAEEVGSRAQHLLFGSSSSNMVEEDSSSSSVEGWDLAADMQQSSGVLGLELITADGLPLALTDGLEGWEGSKLWY